MIVEVIKDMAAFALIFLLALFAWANVFYILDLNAYEY
jgi:hypothetical protein